MNKIFAGVSLVVCLFISCEKRDAELGDVFERGLPVGKLDNKEINEASGLAASKVNPGMLWTHNDNGDKARIFLIDSLGRYRATVLLAGLTNRDWEDIAVGPGPDSTKTYIYIGEIGDNEGIFEHKIIYRIEEVKVAEGDTVVTIHTIDSIKFSLPGRPRDTEALMIDPATKDLYLFSKREHSINVYRLPYPQSTSETFVAERAIKDLPFSQIVAADCSVDGSEILIKDYSNVYYWKRNNNESITELLQTKATRLKYEREPQGESIAFERNGKGYYTLSEKVKGRKPELIFYKRIQTTEKTNKVK